MSCCRSDGACRVCGATPVDAMFHPAPPKSPDNCPPGLCRVCWYRWGRHVPMPLAPAAETGEKA